MKSTAYFLGLLAFCFLCSCSSEGLPTEFTADVERVSIEFLDHEQKPFTVLDSEDNHIISQAIQAVSSQNAPAYKCGYSGKIKYYKLGNNLEADFNLSEDCNHIVFMNGGDLVRKKLSEEGRIFLLSFIKKRQAKQTTIITETPSIAFHFYGEALPTDLVIQDSISLPFGFRMERLTGCEIDAKKIIAIKNHNENAAGQMALLYGENWRENFEKN